MPSTVLGIKSMLKQCFFPSPIPAPTSLKEKCLEVVEKLFFFFSDFRN